MSENRNLVGEYADLSEYGSMRYSITAQSCLQQLNHAERSPNVTKDMGEWVRKLYTEPVAQKIPCFDIELSNNYRDGTRGGGIQPEYKSSTIVNRQNRNGQPLHFFSDGNLLI